MNQVLRVSVSEERDGRTEDVHRNTVPSMRVGDSGTMEWSVWLRKLNTVIDKFGSLLQVGRMMDTQLVLASLASQLLATVDQQTDV